MPRYRTSIVIHDDTMHSGSAKRGGVSGVAPLGADQKVPVANISNHDNTLHDGATANLFAGLTPTLINWTQNPGTPALMVDENDPTTNLSTTGIGAAGNNDIVWDLGTIRRRVVSVSCDLTTPVVAISNDNAQWYTNIKSLVADEPKTIIGRFRYVRFRIAGVQTITRVHFRGYNLN